MVWLLGCLSLHIASGHNILKQCKWDTERETEALDFINNLIALSEYRV